MTITILDKTYEITLDEFGARWIDGKLLDDFMDTLTPEQMAYLADYGVKVMKSDPLYFKDIVERNEITPLEPFTEQIK